MPVPDSEQSASPLLESAVIAHELFTAYVTAGFTQDQALQLVVGLMAASANLPQTWAAPQNRNQ